jgi:hypothetical protein
MEKPMMMPQCGIGRWVGALIILSLTAAGAQAASDTPAFASATVMPVGPRSGDPGKIYLNAQGKKSTPDGKFASFGVIDFHAPAGPQAGKIKGLTLTLVQSIPAFAKNGKVKLYLTTDTKTAIAAVEAPAAPALKFDAASDDGLGDQLKTRYPVGSGTFTKDANGHIDTFPLTLNADAEAYLRGQLEKGGDIRLIIAPDGDDVAATYFGAGNQTPSNRPKLTIEFAP